ncbi:hypothetical protein [Candidatus Symbiopectobacterium sp. NZEC135]|uniref:hypothetical protein n=1 Tax=Candidatus Symbiopectobacterium sp. NZEC135 TaxID=2820471 RepID=UPI0029CAAC88|nr:hypothetical protein [Candidatus Symbiopectobacterium sp. NZEC135]MCW2480475.1 hypothetical protein [Candidatus Symbiopectobacterium sp. NZEC135]
MQNLMPPIESPDNVFHDGNPLTGELGTIVTALFMNNVQAAIRNAQAEIIAIMTDAGIAADAGKSDQLLAALKKTFALNASPALTGNPTAPTQPKADNSTKLATTAHVKSVVADYAPLANPVLTGTPTAPTAAQTVNNTQIATTAFVKAAIAALVDSSPGALDTLNELAAALGDDPNFAATMNAALAAKAPLASPALTGAPTAPTAAAGTNTAQIATTAFVAALAATKASLASPAFTGAPTAPTAAAGTNSMQIATTAFVTALAALKADLASPALTGTPTAPTAATATSNTQIATTAFVKAAIASLVDSAPGALDTLNELAAAIGDDPNFAATMTNALAAKAPLASPALTGTPTAPTAVATTNNTQVASTAHVKLAMAAGTALAATKLATPRTINGVPFDGSTNITLKPEDIGVGEYIILYPNGTESAPGTLINNSRIVIDNPFNTENCLVRTELLLKDPDGNQVWAESSSGSGYGNTNNPAGVTTRIFGASKIVIRALNILVYIATHDGNAWNDMTASITSAKYRVRIVKLA